MDEYAVKAWTARIVIVAQRMQGLAVYNPGSVDEHFLRELAKLSMFDRGPLLAQEFLAKWGIALVVERHLTHTYIDGAALFGLDGRPVVGITLRHDRIDSFWRCLLHEMSHVALHLTLPISASLMTSRQ
jgi:HTH-type transcriptional regulator/antitoxin HigA